MASQDKSFWIFLEGRTQKTASKYILSIQQLTELLNNGLLLQGNGHLITKTNTPPLEPEQFQSMFPPTTDNQQPTQIDPPLQPPPLRIVDQVLSSSPDNVTMTKD